MAHRPGSAAHRLLSLDIVLALLALAGGLRVLYLAAPAPALPGEAATVAHAYALGHLTSFADAGGAGVSPFGWLQLAAATMVPDAFGRSTTALAAVRETVLLAALAGAALLWVLARRLGLPRWAAASALLLLAASPLALGVQRLVVVEHLAAVWVLGALVLITRRRARIRHDMAAAACLLAAVLTSPLALFFLPAAGWLLVRRAPVRAALVAVVLNLGLGIAFGPAAAVLRPHLPAATGPALADWAALDPAWVLWSAVASVAALGVRAVRPFALTGVLLAAVLLVPGVPSTAVLALALPVTPLLVAGVAQALTRRRSPGRHEVADGRGVAGLTPIGVSHAFVRRLTLAHRGNTGRPASSARTTPQPSSARQDGIDHPGPTGSAPVGGTSCHHRAVASAESAPPHLGRTARRFRTAPPQPTHHGRPRRHRRIAPALAATVVVATLAVSWVAGYSALQPTIARGGPLAEARDWVRANASGSRLLVDDAAWAELANAGWPTGMLAPPAACDVSCPAAEWAVFGAGEATLRRHYPALDGALAGAGPTAVFGAGDARVTVWRLGLPPADPGAPPEAPARTHAGEALAASARITLSPEAAAVLREGRADPRLITTIAALAATRPVWVAAFPAVLGEDAAGQPRRRVLLTGDEDGATAFYAGQRDLFRPASVTRTADGVLVTYPLFAPPGLLPPTR
ncbi:hypothetical protein [Amycolatopsis sp.]|uniref:hypothetical protein n=1 Tax=Amycolatopsis sp. TaxID=37632 RepID=UPI002D7F54E9|nr:hypothetical protein [Amycolatopsis sp.]HET6705956.1 hypothetical protein [Amycolatopsis sp.]